MKISLLSFPSSAWECLHEGEAPASLWDGNAQLKQTAPFFHKSMRKMKLSGEQSRAFVPPSFPSRAWEREKIF